MDGIDLPRNHVKCASTLVMVDGLEGLNVGETDQIAEHVHGADVFNIPHDLEASIPVNLSVTYHQFHKDPRTDNHLSQAPTESARGSIISQTQQNRSKTMFRTSQDAATAIVALPLARSMDL